MVIIKLPIFTLKHLSPAVESKTNNNSCFASNSITSPFATGHGFLGVSCSSFFSHVGIKAAVTHCHLLRYKAVLQDEADQG